MIKRFIPLRKIAFPAPKDWPLTGKVLLLALVPIGIVLVVIMSLTITGLNRLEAETSDRTLKENLQIINEQLAQQQTNLQSAAARLTNDVTILDAIARNDRGALRETLLTESIRSGFSHLQVLDVNGHTLGVMQAFDLGEGSDDLKQLNDFGKLEIETIRLVPTPRGWMLTIVKPIKSETGLVGVLSAGKLLDSSVLFDLNFGRTNPRLVFFDAQGNVNADSWETLEGSLEPFTGNFDLWTRAKLEQTTISNTNLQSKGQYVVYVPLSIANRVAMVYALSLSTETSIALRDELTVAVSRAGILTAILAFLGVLIQAQTSITRPIAALTASARKVGAGDLDVVVSGGTSRDEIGLLAEAFNSMTARLRQSMEDIRRRATQLATVAEVSRRISMILDQRRLVVEVVEQLQSAFNYYHVHIYLMDETGENLVMTGGTGDIGAALLGSGHMIPKGKGLVGRAAYNNVPVLVSDTSQDPDWLPNPLLPETKSEAAVPIATADKVLGVLDVQDNKIDGLKQEDIDLLQSLANQVAIALLNTRSYVEIQQRADREARITSIGLKIKSTTSIEAALQATARELGRTLGVNDIRVILESPGMINNSQKPD